MHALHVHVPTLAPQDDTDAAVAIARPRLGDLAGCACDARVGRGAPSDSDRCRDRPAPLRQARLVFAAFNVHLEDEVARLRR